MDGDYFKLLDTITIARSRKHIEKYYNMDEIGRFPKRLTPINKYPEIDVMGEFPPISKINKLINRLSLCVYSPLGYLLPEKRMEYEKKYDVAVGANQSVFSQIDREQSLVGLMRVGILKRLESSINSFALTVEKITNKIKDTIKMIDEGRFTYDPEMNINDMDMDDSEFDNLMFGNNENEVYKLLCSLQRYCGCDMHL